MQSYGPVSADADLSRKYAGAALSGGGFVQVGYDLEQFRGEIRSDIEAAVRNRHIGKEGSVIVCDENLTIIADNGGHKGKSSSSRRCLPTFTS